jgi:hypothetical protein
MAPEHSIACLFTRWIRGKITASAASSIFREDQKESHIRFGQGIESLQRKRPPFLYDDGGPFYGVSMAAAFTMGAIGVQMGTRFVATKESDFSQAWKELMWKELILKSTEEDALVARGFFGRMRFLKNSRALKLVDATLRGSPDLYKGNPCGST